MVMVPAGPGAKNACIGEDQWQFAGNPKVIIGLDTEPSRKSKSGFHPQGGTSRNNAPCSRMLRLAWQEELHTFRPISMPKETSFTIFCGPVISISVKVYAWLQSLARFIINNFWPPPSESPCRSGLFEFYDSCVCVRFD
jgi:hypothetical protein